MLEFIGAVIAVSLVLKCLGNRICSNIEGQNNFSFQPNFIRTIKLPLSEKAKSILDEKNPGWEYLFFAQVFQDELDSHEYKYSFWISGKREEYVLALTNLNVIQWIRNRINELQALVRNIDSFVNIDLRFALGPIGISGNPDDLQATAHNIADIYYNALLWSIELRSAYCGNTEYIRLLQLLCEASEEIVRDMHEWPERIVSKTIEGLELINKNPAEKIVIDLEFLIKLPDSWETKFIKEIERLRHIGIF